MNEGLFRPIKAGMSVVLPGHRWRSWLLGGIALIACGLIAGYHVMMMQGWEPTTPAGVIVYNALVLFAYLVIYLLLSDRFRRRPPTAIRVFWLPILVGVGFVAIHFAFTSFARLPELSEIAPEPVALGFEYGTGRPLVPATVFNMNVISLAGAAFAFILLLRFRDLVLVKRTKASRRNWYLMLGFMVFASALTFLKSPTGELNFWQRLATVPAVGFMVVNSLRLSWIVFLSLSEKLVSILMSLFLLVILAGVGIMEDSLVASSFGLPTSYTFLKHYSYPLSVFVSLSVIFGILYCTTAVLSLVFHLPTTSDYQQRAGELAAMHSLTNLVGQVFEPDRLYEMIVASPIESGAANAAWLAVPARTSATLAPQVVATRNIDGGRIDQFVEVGSLYEEVAETGKPLLLDQALTDHRVSARPGDGIGSLLAVPLLARSEMLGALFVTKDVSHGFEKDDAEAVGLFAAQAALAIDNARLLEERIEKERLAREMAIAREVQVKLLPQRLPTLPGVSIAASSVAAHEVGGDYFDFSTIDEHRIAFIVADVSGKGTSAAFYMAEMQGIFRSLTRLAPAPRTFLEHANATLSSILERSVFVSVIYGVLDARGETISLARAGHCPAAAISVDGSARLMRTPGMGLGLDRGSVFSTALSEEVVALRPGDVFVLYTDGVIESRGLSGDQYGYDRLLEVLRKNRHEEAHDLHKALTHDLTDFIGSSDYDDDMTLVIMKWHGIDVRSLNQSAVPEEAQMRPA